MLAGLDASEQCRRLSDKRGFMCMQPVTFPSCRREDMLLVVTDTVVVKDEMAESGAMRSL